MSEPTEVQALEKISTEVGDSQIKITLSSQCIKAQAFLVDKLRKQSERQKEICCFISKNNLKLQTEISQAEIEIKSLMVAKETIKSSNIELKKECLLLKERKSEIEERIAEGEKRYENLWLQAKARYESIPRVQILLQAQNKAERLKENLLILKNKSDNLIKEYDIKKQFVANSDRKRIVELAHYIVQDLPASKKVIEEKLKFINEISKHIDEIIKQQDDKENEIAVTTTENLKTLNEENQVEKSKKEIEDAWYNICQDNQPDSLTMPQIQLIQSDFDALSAKLDKIKIKKIDMFYNIPAKRIEYIEPDTGIYYKKPRMDDDDRHVVFDQNIAEDLNKKEESFSKRKLINILDDIKLDKNDAYKIVSKINAEEMKSVNKIGAEMCDKIQCSNDIKQQVINEEIEEIDLTTKSDNNNILVPPTQFLDYGEFQTNHMCDSQQQVEVIVHMSMTDTPGKVNKTLMNSQEIKKKVCFDLPLSIQEINEENENVDDLSKMESDNTITTLENEAIYETVDSHLDAELVSDEKYNEMKDMILKKHNLDLSPQFMYAKNTALQGGKNIDEKNVTSKFFKSSTTNNTSNKENSQEVTDNSQNCENEIIEQNLGGGNINLEEDQVIASSPKVQNKYRPTLFRLENIPQKPDRMVTGLLFNHGTQGIPDSLNVSISTTGFEEGDSDYPQCIDSSLLLSPKADNFPLPSNMDNTEISSQEVPNFLSGLRRTGFSFFGQTASTSDSKQSTSEQTQNNFNFNFGDEKKGRTGLFSMFR